MHRWIDHTGELELAVEGESAEAVLGEASLAFGEAESGDAGQAREGATEPTVPPSAERRIHALEVSAPDEPALLVEWLSELVYLADVEGLVPERVSGVSVSRSDQTASARGTVEGPIRAANGLVKAVTYHRLEFGRRDGIWRATVIFDV